MSMGRYGVPGARSPFPLAGQVPSMLADDPMAVAFLEALDEVIAPAIGVLDCFDAYLDPRLAPPDMVGYLGSWILAMVDDVWDEGSVRADVAGAQAGARWAGTARAIEDRMGERGVRAVIDDPGSTLTSEQPTDPTSWIDPEDPTVTVHGSLVPGAEASLDVLDRSIARLMPAHVPHRIVWTVSSGDGTGP